MKRSAGKKGVGGVGKKIFNEQEQEQEHFSCWQEGSQMAGSYL